MIRLLQQDSRLMKWIFAVIIGFAAVTMVITLVPGIFDNASANDASVYATVRQPGYFGRIFGESTQIKTTEVNQIASRQLQQQRLPESLLPYLLPRAGQILVQRAILKHEADRMNLQVSDEDLRRELRTGPFAQYLFPNGNYIGDDAYIDFVQRAFGNQLSRSEFESQVKSDMELNRLQALITGGVTVSDKAVRDAYKTDGTKVKFDYVVITADDVRKGITRRTRIWRHSSRRTLRGMRRRYRRRARFSMPRLIHRIFRAGSRRSPMPICRPTTTRTRTSTR